MNNTPEKMTKFEAMLLNRASKILEDLENSRVKVSAKKSYINSSPKQKTTIMKNLKDLNSFLKREVFIKKIITDIEPILDKLFAQKVKLFFLNESVIEYMNNKSFILVPEQLKILISKHATRNIDFNKDMDYINPDIIKYFNKEQLNQEHFQEFYEKCTKRYDKIALCMLILRVVTEHNINMKGVNKIQDILPIIKSLNSLTNEEKSSLSQLIDNKQKMNVSNNIDIELLQRGYENKAFSNINNLYKQKSSGNYCQMIKKNIVKGIDYNELADKIRQIKKEINKIPFVARVYEIFLWDKKTQVVIMEEYEPKNIMFFLDKDKKYNLDLKYLKAFIVFMEKILNLYINNNKYSYIDPNQIYYIDQACAFQISNGFDFVLPAYIEMLLINYEERNKKIINTLLKLYNILLLRTKTEVQKSYIEQDQVMIMNEIKDYYEAVKRSDKQFSLGVLLNLSINLDKVCKEKLDLKEIINQINLAKSKLEKRPKNIQKINWQLNFAQISKEKYNENELPIVDMMKPVKYWLIASYNNKYLTRENKQDVTEFEINQKEEGFCLSIANALDEIFDLSIRELIKRNSKNNYQKLDAYSKVELVALVLQILALNELSNLSYLRQCEVNNIFFHEGFLVLDMISITKASMITSVSTYLREFVREFLEKNFKDSEFLNKSAMDFLNKGQVTMELWEKCYSNIKLCLILGKSRISQINQINKFEYHGNFLDDQGSTLPVSANLMEAPFGESLDSIIEKVISVNKYLIKNLGNSFYDALISLPEKLTLSGQKVMIMIIRRMREVNVELNKNSFIQMLRLLYKKIEKNRVQLPWFDGFDNHFVLSGNRYKVSLFYENQLNLQLIQAILQIKNHTFQGEFINKSQIQKIIFKELYGKELTQDTLNDLLKRDLTPEICEFVEKAYPQFNQDLELNRLGLNPFILFEPNIAKEFIKVPCKYEYRRLQFALDQINNPKIKSKVKEILECKSGIFKKLTRINDQTYLVAYDLCNGDMIYLGDFDENLVPSGKGFFYSKDYLYKGHYKNNIKHGYGEYYDLKTLTFYIGEFIDDKYHGQGTEYYASGIIKYKGNWVEGFLEGEGEHTQPGGLKYKGGFKKGQYHGKGKILFSTGICHMDGQFVEGKMDGIFSIYTYSGEFLRTAYYELNVLKPNPQTKKFKIKIIDDDSDSDNSDIIIKPKVDLNPPEVKAVVEEREIKQENDKKIINQEFNQLIYKEEIDRLLGCQWLNSKNINFFISYLKQKYQEQYYLSNNSFQSKITNLKKILYFQDTIFAILTKGTSQVENFQYIDAIHYETIPYQGYGFLIFDIYDRIIFINNLNDAHWCLSEINTENKSAYKFIRYDSLRNPSNNARNDSILSVLNQYAKMEVDKKCENEYKHEYIKRIEEAEYIIAKVPQQTNGYDCGIFVCGFLEDITNQKQIQFNQEQAKNLRLRLANIEAGDRTYQTYKELYPSRFKTMTKNIIKIFG